MICCLGIDLDSSKDRSLKAMSDVDEDGVSSTYFNSEMFEETSKIKVAEIIDEMCKMQAFNRYQELNQKVMKLKEEHVDIDELLMEYKEAIVANKSSEGEMDHNEKWIIKFCKLLHTYYNKDYITMLDTTTNSKENIMKTVQFLVLNYKRDGNDVQSLIYSLRYLNRCSKVYDALTLAYSMKVFYDELCIKKSSFQKIKEHAEHNLLLFIDYRDIFKQEEQLDHQEAIIKGINTLESYQMHEEADIICRMIPMIRPDYFTDNEQFIFPLLRNASVSTIQYIEYQIKTKNYRLIER